MSCFKSLLPCRSFESGNQGNQILEENTRQILSKFCFILFVQQQPELERMKNWLSFFTKKEANVDVIACLADKYLYFYKKKFCHFCHLLSFFVIFVIFCHFLSFLSFFVIFCHFLSFLTFLSFLSFFFVIFLDASSHLYMRVCPSVRPSVCREDLSKSRSLVQIVHSFMM